MSSCSACGATNQFAKFCVNCGSSLSSPRGPDKQTMAWSSTPDARSSTAFASAPHGAAVAPVAMELPPTRRRMKQWVMNGAASIVVLLIAGIAVIVLRRPATTDQAGPPATTAVPTVSSSRTTVRPMPELITVPDPVTMTVTHTATTSVEAPPPIVTATVEAPPIDTTSTEAPTTEATYIDDTPAPNTAVAEPDPMGGPNASFSCNTGYIVQIASDRARADYEARVAQIRASGTLPADARWTETTASWHIFAGSTSAYALYVGTFASPNDGCDARLAGPADAFIRSTSTGVNEFISCLCPASPASLVTIVTPGQTSVWVGELQRLLGHSNYGMDDVEGSSKNWGIYTTDTKAAVIRFQTDHGLPADGSVGGKTWTALQTAIC